MTEGAPSQETEGSGVGNVTNLRGPDLKLNITFFALGPNRTDTSQLTGPLFRPIVTLNIFY